MTTRRGSASHIAPSTKAVQPDHTDDVFEWIRRQNNPVKLPKPLAKVGHSTSVEEAVVTALLTRKYKAADELQLDDGASTESREGTN